MRQSVRFDDISKRPLRYWSEDGVPDLVLGLWCACTALIFLAARMLPKGSSAASVYPMAAPALWGLSSLAMVRGLKALKERITFPRTGYVALRERGWRYAFTAALGALPIAVYGVVLTTGFELPHWERFAGPALAMIFAITLFVGGLRYKLPHLLGLAVFSLVPGAWTYWIEAGMDGTLWVMLSLGGAMAIAGALRLRSFLAANPKPGDLPA